MKSRFALVLLVAVAGVAVYVGNVLATPQSGLTTTILGKSTFDPISVSAHTPVFGPDGRLLPSVWLTLLKTLGQTDVYVVDNKLAPGGTTGWHSHPGPSLILVVSGTVTNYMGDDRTCMPHVYSAGAGFIDEGDGHVHMLRNESDAPAETIAVQLLPKDATRKIDVPTAPGNCPF